MTDTTEQAFQALKALLNEVLPVLDQNLGSAHREYLDGQIPHGAYGYVLGRHSNACALLALEGEIHDEAALEKAYQTASRLTFDLKTGCRDAANPALLEKWMRFFDGIGFTDRHKPFEYPQRPVPQQPVPQHPAADAPGDRNARSGEHLGAG
jgi:hypothetical protein